MWLVLALLVFGLVKLGRKLADTRPQPGNWDAVAADFGSPAAAARQDAELPE